MPVLKVIELVGTSPNSWEEATENAVNKAAETLRGIVGADVVRHNVAVEDGKITEYRVDVKIAFLVEEGSVG
ncbi:MAG: transporter [Anaerolineae bacterium]|nr:transporter [Anaerolineae bacterium]NIN98879.1 transporter [Anaerolineae bacterium]NIQ81790.1 transporter [Anaerolineae bacterium]